MSNFEKMLSNSEMLSSQEDAFEKSTQLFSSLIKYIERGRWNEFDNQTGLMSKRMKEGDPTISTLNNGQFSNRSQMNHQDSQYFDERFKKVGYEVRRVLS